MKQTIKVSAELIKQAGDKGVLHHRNAAEQIEEWARIGQLSLNHPDLSLNDMPSDDFPSIKKKIIKLNRRDI